MEKENQEPVIEPEPVVEVDEVIPVPVVVKAEEKVSHIGRGQREVFEDRPGKRHFTDFLLERGNFSVWQMMIVYT